jgi:hypothetical protein
MKYELLTSAYPQGLANIVNEYLEAGWKLYGNPHSIVVGESARSCGYIEFIQAMTKED